MRTIHGRVPFTAAAGDTLLGAGVAGLERGERAIGQVVLVQEDVDGGLRGQLSALSER
jgi:hypothetical protein